MRAYRICIKTRRIGKPAGFLKKNLLQKYVKIVLLYIMLKGGKLSREHGINFQEDQSYEVL